jgi:hypothetical protein
MGLDTSHGCWSGPYSAFSSWRNALCLAAGWHLYEKEYNDGFKMKLPREINWDEVTNENIRGEWERLPEDPLVVLIAHSDCDGQLPVEVLLPLADRLEQLLDKFADDGPPGAPRPRPDHWRADEPWPPQRAHYDGYRAATLRFIVGLRRAAAARESVEFH